MLRAQPFGAVGPADPYALRRSAEPARVLTVRQCRRTEESSVVPQYPCIVPAQDAFEYPRSTAIVSEWVVSQPAWVLGSTRAEPRH